MRHASAAGLICLTCLLCLAAARPGLAATAPAAGSLHRYWPRFPRPRTLLRVPFVGDHEEGMTYETAAGLAARADLQGRASIMVLEDVDASNYRRWTAAMLSLVKPLLEPPLDTWGAVAELKRRGLVKGYILFRYDTSDRAFNAAGPIDESANVATSLAPIFDAVAVSERLQPRAEALGLPMLFDARNRTEKWCLDTYGPRFSRRLVMTADPKSRVARSMAVATGAFVVSQPGPTYDAALARCEPDCPVLGWGCGAEDKQTIPSSRWGLFQTATNWCENLPVYSTEQVGETIPRKAVESPTGGLSFFDLRWETGVHYATFLMSDGDNVQWLMGNFTGGAEGHFYYDSPARGRFPMGWTIPYVDLAQLCPYVLEDLFRRATPDDDFVLLGGGYFYPDLYGISRKGDRPGGHCLALHARRIAAYMRLGRLHSIAFNLQDWDGAAARSAYRTLAANIPTLDGIYAFQYYPYSGGEGRILWTSRAGTDLPIVSCALCIWANTGRPRDTTPAGVAKWINAAPDGGLAAPTGGSAPGPARTWSDKDFTFVIAHAWSRFRDTHGDPSVTAEDAGVDQSRDTPGTSRGLLPVEWTVDRLGPRVRVVTPGKMLLLVRLHLRTRQTLREMDRELRTKLGAHPAGEAARRLARAEALLPRVRDGDESGRECFDLLREVYIGTEGKHQASR